MKIKKFGLFLLYFLPWFLSSIFLNSNQDYYQSLKLPFFAPPSWLFMVIWPILYFLVALSIYKVFKDSPKSYKISLVINYILNQSYTLVFFYLKDNFLAFVSTLSIFISSLFLYNETNKIDKKASNYLIPYIIWSGFATILSLAIFFLNR